MPPDYPARIGRYDVVAVIGEGRLGTVYQAFDEAHARLVSIRVLSPALLADAPRLERFRRGLRLSAKIEHENLLRTLDEGQDGDLVYVVTEYVDGGTLFDRLDRSRLTLAEAAHVLSNVADGLGAAHRGGLVHGDLNPRNVFVSRDMSVAKVGDFGTEDRSAATGTTRTTDLARARLVSTLYRAPELANEHAQPTVRSDIYSVGVIAYEALTGKLPIGKFGLPSDVNNQVPLQLDPIVLRCLASDPAQRYQSVEALRADLDKVAEVVGDRLLQELKRLSGGRLFATKQPGRSAKRRRTPRLWHFGLAAAVLVVVAVTGALMLRGRGERASKADAPPPTAAAQPAAAAVPPASEPAAQPAPVTAAPVPPSPVTAAGAPSTSAGPPATPPQHSAPAPTRPPDSAAAAPAPLPPPQAAGDRPAAPPASAEPVAKPVSTPPRKPAPEPAPTAPPAPDPEALAGALFTEAQLLVKQNQDIAARAKLASIGERYWQTRWFVPAMMVKIDIEDRRGLREQDAVTGRVVPASLPTKRLLTRHAPQHAAAEAAWWQLGKSYDRLKEYALAVQAYVELATRFPDTRFDAWFKAGEITERRLKKREEARAAYLKVPATSSRYRDAQDRARKLAGR
jgi:serine/threonine-protein kinase